MNPNANGIWQHSLRRNVGVDCTARKSKEDRDGDCTEREKIRIANGLRRKQNWFQTGFMTSFSKFAKK